MKSLKKLLFILPLVFLVACGGADTGARISRNLNMATGGTGGTYYPFGGAMALTINNNTELNITVNASGASADNIRQISVGDAHLAIAQNDVMHYAATGTGIFDGHEPITNLATLMSLYPETVQIVVLADSGIYSVEDLRGRRVSTGDIGSGVAANANQVLNMHGLTTDDINQVHLGFGPSADAMRDLVLDAFFVTAATPNTAVMELSTSRNLRILNIEDDMIQALMAAHPFYVRVRVDSSDYPFIETPVYTVAVQATLIASTEMDEQQAYDIVEALIDNQQEVLQGHARGAYISLENAVQSISVDFHPGARRFFEERGALN